MYPLGLSEKPLLVPLTALLAKPQPLDAIHSTIQCTQGILTETAPQHTGQHGVSGEETALQKRRGRLDKPTVMLVM